MVIRDSGWIIFFAENNQEAVDLHIQAFKLSEKINLPTMVCVDGFNLTHTFEPIEIREQKMIDKFLPKRKPKKETFLNIESPITIGGLSTPSSYMPTREKMHKDLLEAKKDIKKIFIEFNKLFSVRYPDGCMVNDGMIEYIGPENPNLIFIASGSVLGTIKSVYDYNSRQKNKVGILRIRCFRPFPEEEILNIFKKIKPENIAVIDRSVSLGLSGILFSEIKNICCGKINANLKNFIMGLGGKDITPNDIKDISLNFKRKTELRFVL
jgi:pyruvate/2-oxoacid:ferredoxin oxidoreductase alpha subunit